MKPFYAPGRYNLTVIDQAWMESRNGSDMLALKTRVESQVVEEYQDGELVHREALVSQNYPRTIYIVFSQNNAEYAIAKLRHAGFTGRTFDELNLVGNKVIGVCTEGTYKNEPSEQWDLALPPRDGGPSLESKPGVTRKLNAMFGKLLNDGVSTPKPATGAAAPNSNDPIPF